MKNTKKNTIKLLILIFSIILLTSLYNLGKSLYNIYSTNNKLNNIMNLKTETNTNKLNGKDIIPELNNLYSENKDTIGVLKIPNTNVNYPVMQSKSDSEYYLSHDFYKNDDKNGLPFLDYRNNIENPSSNLIIHGHNMKSGLMFNTLTKYKNKDFLSEHRKIVFNTLFEESEYEIISVFLSKIYNKDDNVFKYYQFINASNETEFNNYITNIKKLSIYEIDSTASYGDSLITLSTCDYTEENGRLVVVAKKI